LEPLLPLGEVVGKQGTWRQSITSLVVSVLALLTFRWIVFEPYVIPSGSMIPTLKVLDFIYVNKFAYGLRLPFSSTWLFERALPERCEIVVFRSQTEPGIFLIKRVMGLPGERVELLESGRVRINDKMLETKKIHDGEDYNRYEESCGEGQRSHLMQSAKGLSDLEVDPVIYAVTVPENHLVMFGDNRHESADSRVWGTLPRTELLGEALGIWLSCAKSLPGMPRLCDPSSLRFERMFHGFDEVPK
jgi:signal peptidase I